MNNTAKKVKVYDTNLDLIYEVKLDRSPQNHPRLNYLLERSKLFLEVEDTSYYRLQLTDH